MMCYQSALLLLALLGALPASGQVSPAPGQTTQKDISVESIATDALAIIGDRYPIKFEDYLILMCTSDRQQSLAKDSDIGAYVRYTPLAKGNLAVVVMPAGSNSGATYCVYFDTNKPLGIVTTPEGRGNLKDADVAKAYTPLVGMSIPRWEDRPRFKWGKIKADDGTEIFALKVIGTKRY